MYPGIPTANLRMKGQPMKKLTIPLIILAVIFAICRFMPEKPIGTVIINMGKFPDYAQRSEIKDCLEGKLGLFTQPVEITLYTDGESTAHYRALMARLESWGADVTLRRETAQNIFDFRALGELSIYIWDDEPDNIYEAFLTRNAVFFSTGYANDEYDKLVSDGKFDEACNLLIRNISIVKV